MAAFFTYMTLLETRGDVNAVVDKMRNSYLQTVMAGACFVDCFRYEKETVGRRGANRWGAGAKHVRDLGTGGRAQGAHCLACWTAWQVRGAQGCSVVGRPDRFGGVSLQHEGKAPTDPPAGKHDRAREGRGLPDARRTNAHNLLFTSND